MGDQISSLEKVLDFVVMPAFFGTIGLLVGMGLTQDAGGLNEFYNCS